MNPNRWQTTVTIDKSTKALSDQLCKRLNANRSRVVDLAIQVLARVLDAGITAVAPELRETARLDEDQAS